jgi:hypothetical protein
LYLFIQGRDKSEDKTGDGYVVVGGGEVNMAQEGEVRGGYIQSAYQRGVQRFV